MSIETQKETLGFEAEVKQLLNLMVNALYSNKEIFLRELVSNSSDASDKLRFESLSDAALFEDDPELKVHVSIDKEKRRITITDNGIGMTRDEMIANIGTIAKSGTKEFLESMTGDNAEDTKLIGQFGVGFYSVFVVADKVTVKSRRAGLTSEHGVLWESDGSGEYTIENITKDSRGTEVILHLKKDEDEFLDDWRLRSIVTKYSDHITLPIMMHKPEETGKDEDKKEEKKDKKIEWEKVNKATALWILPKKDIKDEEYSELYKHVSHDFQDPLLWSHNRVEGKSEYISLLFIPSQAPFDLWNREHKHGIKLYVKRVFIMDDAEQFLPNYLRFVKGVIDSNDLPLNISREILQHNHVVTKIRSAVIKRVLDMLDKTAKDDPEKYAKFWEAFGRVMKEGPAEDFENREKIAKLMRFSTTHSDNEKQDISLDDYISRMKEGQDKIYYVTAESFLAAKNSPHLEIFRKKGIEVLLLTDNVDEWFVSHLSDYSGKHLQSVAKGELDDKVLESEEDKKEEEKQKDEFASVIDHVQKVLGEKVKEVRITNRLTTSPACIVADAYDMNMNMQRILQSVGQPAPESKPIFELNPDHTIVKRLKSETDDDRFSEWTEILFDQSVLAEGGQLKDPATFVSRLNKLLLELAG